MEHSKSHLAKTAACTDPGQDHFESVRCESPVVSTPTNIEFCDARLWSHLIRSSGFDGDWKKVDKVKTVTTSCVPVRIKFYRFQDNEWQLFHQVDFLDGTLTWVRTTGVEYYMKVDRKIIGDTGSFRAFTRFSKD